jgi:hypothetical protein
MTVVVFAQMLKRNFAATFVLSTDCACTVTVAVEVTLYDPMVPEMEQVPADSPMLTWTVGNPPATDTSLAEGVVNVA